MEILSFGQVAENRIRSIEEKCSILLLADYKHFLINNNGAKVKDGSFFVKGLNQDILLDILFGIDLANRSLNLDFWFQEFVGEIPSQSLPIGRDPGGGFLLLINNGENNGIYYYDHSYFFEESSDEENTYFIAASFNEFIKLLQDVNESKPR